MVLQCVYSSGDYNRVLYNAHFFNYHESSASSMTFGDPYQCVPPDLMKSSEEEIISAKSTSLKHKRRYCRIDGCHRIVKSQGLCQRHGAKPKKCKIDGCSKQAQGNFEGMCKAHFREISASSHASASAHQENESQSSSHDTSSIANDSSYQNSNDVAQQSVNCYSNTFYDPLPHPNASFANSPMDWTNQASHYGPYPSDFAPQLQPFPYQQQYPSHPQPWIMPSTAVAAPTTMEIPYVYYEPGSLQRNAFSPETEPLEPICDATSFLRRDSMASLNLPHHQERHPPPRYFTHPGGDAASGAHIDPPPPGHYDELSLQYLEFPDDEDLSVIGGPHTEV